jgi:hypothetical protein
MTACLAARRRPAVRRRLGRDKFDFLGQQRRMQFPSSFDRRLPRLAIEPAVEPDPALERAA